MSNTAFKVTGVSGQNDALLVAFRATDSDLLVIPLGGIRYVPATEWDGTVYVVECNACESIVEPGHNRMDAMLTRNYEAACRAAGDHEKEFRRHIVRIHAYKPESIDRTESGTKMSTFEIRDRDYDAFEGITVRAYEGSCVHAYEGSTVYAHRDSTVYAYKGSTVTALAGSIVRAHAGSIVTAARGSSVTAYPGSTVTVSKGGNVYAYEDSSITYV